MPPPSRKKLDSITIQNYYYYYYHSRDNPDRHVRSLRKETRDVSAAKRYYSQPRRPGSPVPIIRTTPRSAYDLCIDCIENRWLPN